MLGKLQFITRLVQAVLCLTQRSFVLGSGRARVRVDDHQAGFPAEVCACGIEH